MDKHTVHSSSIKVNQHARPSGKTRTDRMCDKTYLQNVSAQFDTTEVAPVASFRSTQN
jgi:hypothetical protein